MSLMRSILNLHLRLTELPHLRRVADQHALRRSFETKARLFFHGPRSVAQEQTQIGAMPALKLTANTIGPSILCFHGGGYVFGSPRTHCAMLKWLCRQADAQAVLPDYRKAPENLFPAAIEDAISAYSHLLDEGAIPAKIVIGGDSAGGGLALALMAEIIKSGMPIPAGGFAFSPLTDLTHSGESIIANADSDVVLPASRVLEMTDVIIGDGDRKDPRASPLFANFKGAPPMWLRVGDTEILRDDTWRMADVLEQQGVQVDVKTERDLPHVWPLFHNLLPEARSTLREAADWIRQRTALTSES